MKQFFRENKTFIAIIIGALIIGGFIYLSHKPVSTTISPSGKGIIENSTPVKSPEVSKCIDYTEAPNHVGEYGCVRGKVDHVYTSRKGNNFLNFCADYRACPFSAVIFSSDSYKFSNIKGYSKKTVEISGLIKTYKGRAEIIINDPSQIKVR